jgi:hypothetical protein
VQRATTVLHVSVLAERHASEMGGNMLASSVTLLYVHFSIASGTLGDHIV